jgi:hypothetical protein
MWSTAYPVIKKCKNFSSSKLLVFIFSCDVWARHWAHMCGRREPHRKFWRGNLGERENVEDLGVQICVA